MNQQPRPYGSFVNIILMVLVCAAIICTGCGKKAGQLGKDVPAEGTGGRVGLGNSNNSAEGEQVDSPSAVTDDILEIPEVASYSERTLNLKEPVVEQQEQSVTMMIYMVGSDLESKSGAATRDLQEMADSGIDLSCNNILVYTGGCEQWFSDISSESNAIYQLTAHGLQKVKEYKSSSMGNPSNLTEFLKYSYDNYKTDSYNLILWNHGNGPVLGYGKDRLYENDALLLSEIRSALEASPFKSENKLGFIGFDACLMASAELACSVSGYAEYLVSSQEVEPNFGWNYAFLKDCGKVTNKSLACLAVYDYIKYCDDYFRENENFCNDVTLACIDLSYADELSESVNALFDEAIKDVSGSYNALALERFHTRSLGRATTGSEYDLVDVYSLMNSMGEKYNKATAGVKSVVDKMVCFSGDNTTDCCGMSIYYPYFNKKHYSDSWREDYKKVGQFKSYQKYLDSFAQIWMGTDMMALFTEPLTPEEYVSGSYSLPLSEEQQSCYLSSGYYILRKEGEGVFSVVSYSEDTSMEDGTITADYDGRALMVSDDFGRKIPVASEVTDIVDDNYYHSVNIIARDRMYDDLNGVVPYQLVDGEIQLIVDHETSQVEVAGYYELSEEDTKADSIKSGKKIPLDTDAMMVLGFAQRVPVYPERDKNGVLLPIDEWLSTSIKQRDIFSMENGIHFSYEPMYEDGYEYFLMFDVVDTQAHHYSSELMPVVLAKGTTADETLPVTNYKWTDPTDPPVISSEKVDIRFIESENLSGDESDVYGLHISNNSDSQIQIKIKDVLVNGQYETGFCANTEVFSGHSDILYLKDIDSILKYSDSDRLDIIRFSYQISDYITGKIISDWSSAQVQIDKSVTPGVLVMDLRGAIASKQTLLEDARVKIELIDGGNYPGAFTNKSTDITNSFMTRLKITNKSKAVLEAQPVGFRINGVAYGGDYEGEDGYSPRALEPQETKYMTFRSWRINDGIDWDVINSASLIMAVTEEGEYQAERMVLPITLDNPPKDVTDVTDNLPCVYKDENVEVYDYGSCSNNFYSMTPVYRGLIVVNKTDKRIDVDTVSEEFTQENVRLHKGDKGVLLIRTESGETGLARLFDLNVELRNEDGTRDSDYVISQIHLEEEHKEVPNQNIPSGKVAPRIFVGSNISAGVGGTHNSAEDVYDIRPFEDAMCMAQVISSDNRVDIELKYLGSVGADSDNMRGVIAVTNKTKESIPYVLQEVIINGYCFSVSDSAIVSPGNTYFSSFFVKKESIEEAGITSISSVSLYLLTDYEDNTSISGEDMSGGKIYKLKLDKKGTGKMSNPEGELIYDENNIKVHIIGRSVSDGDGPFIRFAPSATFSLMVENKTDKDISFNYSETKLDGKDCMKGGAIVIELDRSYENRALMTNVIPAGCRKQIDMTFRSWDMTFPCELSCRLDFMSAGGGKLLHRSDTITLQSAELDEE